MRGIQEDEPFDMAITRRLPHHPAILWTDRSPSRKKGKKITQYMDVRAVIRIPSGINKMERIIDPREKSSYQSSLTG